MNINSTFNISRMKEKSREFWLTLFLNPLFLLIVIVYVAGKMTTNLVMGASLVNALRSSIMGFIIYTLGCYLMHLISNVNQELEEANEIKGEKGFIVWIIGWLVVAQFLLSINVMNTYDVINFRIPLWGQLTETWLSFIERVSESNDYIDGMGLVGIPNLILYVLIPSIILWKCRFKFPKFFGLKTSLAAIPFVAIYLLSFIVIKGISLASLLTLLFVLMWPALGEEFLQRNCPKSTYEGYFKTCECYCNDVLIIYC